MSRRNELRLALKSLSDRCLYKSAKWVGELLASEINEKEILGKNNSVEIPVEDAVLLAITYFQLKEFRRAAHCLRNSKSAHGFFLKNYSTYMAGEKEKEETMFEAKDTNSVPAGLRLVQPNVTETSSAPPGATQTSSVNISNKELPNLLSILESSPFCNSEPDSFCLYLYAVVLAATGRSSQCRNVLISSLKLMPFNWSAWKLLASQFTDANLALNLPITHWMRDFFLLDLFSDSEPAPTFSEDPLLRVSPFFSNCTHITASKALMLYHSRDFDQAQALFEELRQLDPYRLEGLDIYSNLLYIKEARADLSFLAQTVWKIDKFRVESCVILGNYYSLKGNHQKSLLYFKRSLRLDPNYLAAWTLMGHELVEMRMTSAAIEAYRHAVDINPLDFRAWYGLGQTYEMLQMYSYALYYFHRSSSLRPSDPRMWCAMGEAYERLGREQDAIRCFLKADTNKDKEGMAVGKLAALYASLDGDINQQKAAEYYRRLIRRDKNITPETIEARLFLSEHCKRSLSLDSIDKTDKSLLLNEAVEHATILIESGGSIARDAAKALLAELRLMQVSIK